MQYGEYLAKHRAFCLCIHLLYAQLVVLCAYKSMCDITVTSLLSCLSAQTNLQHLLMSYRRSQKIMCIKLKAFLLIFIMVQNIRLSVSDLETV